MHKSIYETYFASSPSFLRSRTCLVSPPSFIEVKLMFALVVYIMDIPQIISLDIYYDMLFKHTNEH